MKRIRVGVMGGSAFAVRAMIPALQECEATELVCIASRSQQKAAELGARFQCDTVTGYERLLERDDLDAVYVPLPTGLHEEWCGKVLASGRHLLVEKSFATDLPSATRLVGIAQRQGLLAMENFQFQTHRQWPRIKECLTSGILGEVRLVRSTFGFPALPKDNFRWNRELGGGALLDAGAYMAKVSQLLLGRGLEVCAASRTMDPQSGVDIYGEAMLRSASGQVAQVAFGFDYFYQCRVELLGTKGRLSTHRVFTAPPGFEPRIFIETAAGREELLIPADNHYVNMWRHFAEVLGKGDYSEEYEILLDQARLLAKMAGN